MKRTVLLSCLLGLLAGCEQYPAPQQATTPPVLPSPARPAKQVVLPEGAVQGDFDGDGTPEYVWLVPPRIDSTGEDCVGRCVSYLTSSNPTLKPYALNQSLGGELTTLHHLGADRRDYVGILPSWFTSCWNDYHVLTYRLGGWQYGVRPFSTHCNQWEAGVIPILPDSAHAGHVLIHYSEFAHDSITTETKSVPLK